MRSERVEQAGTFDSRTGFRAAAKLWSALRDARWATRERIAAYAKLLLLGYGLFFLWLLSGAGLSDPMGRPIGTDFLSFWSVSAALRDGRVDLIYAPPALGAWEASFLPGTPYYAWFYPPLALLLVAPLALLPYLWSLLAWLALGLAAYLGVIRSILRDRLAVMVALAFPAVFVTLSHGQNAFVTTSLFGGAMLLLARRPSLAGVLIGCLAFKPQLGVLIPLALLAGREWRTLAAAAATVLVLGAASLLLYGPGVWGNFTASLAFSRHALEFGDVPFGKMQSIFAAIRLLGGGIAAAYGGQVLLGSLAAVAVVWTWRQNVGPDLKAGVLVLGSLLATPFLLDYDLLLLALPMAGMVRRGMTEGGAAFEWSGWGLAYALPLIARPLALATGIGLSPLVIAGLLVVVLRRVAGTVRSAA